MALIEQLDKPTTSSAHLGLIEDEPGLDGYSDPPEPRLLLRGDAESVYTDAAKSAAAASGDEVAAFAGTGTHPADALGMEGQSLPTFAAPGLQFDEGDALEVPVGTGAFSWAQARSTPLTVLATVGSTNSSPPRTSLHLYSETSDALLLLQHRYAAASGNLAILCADASGSRFDYSPNEGNLRTNADQSPYTLGFQWDPARDRHRVVLMDSRSRLEIDVDASTFTGLFGEGMRLVVGNRDTGSDALGLLYQIGVWDEALRGEQMRKAHSDCLVALGL